MAGGGPAAAAQAVSATAAAHGRRGGFTAPRPAKAVENDGGNPKKTPAAAQPRGGAAKRLPRDPTASAAAKKSKAMAAKKTAAAAADGVPPPPPPPPPSVPSPPPADVEELLTPTATITVAHNVLDTMSQSVDDEAFLRYTNVANEEFASQEFASQDYEQTQYEDEELELGDEDLELDEEEEGFLDGPKGRTANYTTSEDVLICTAWKKISLDASVGIDQPNITYWKRIKEYFDERNTSGHVRTFGSLRHRWSTISKDCFKWSCCLKNVDRINPSGCNEDDKMNLAQGMFWSRGKKGEKKKKGKPFTLHHCWVELEHDEKWKTRETLEIPNKKKSSVGHDDDSSEDEDKRSGTPNSVTAKSKRPDGRKKEKVTKARDNDIKESLEAIVNARKTYAEEKKALKIKEMEERAAAELRKAAAEEKKAAAEDKRAAAEERMALAEEKKAEVEARRVQLEERKQAMTEERLAEEKEAKMMFMDTSGMDAKQKAFVEMYKDQILAKRSMNLMSLMGGGMGGGMMSGGMNAMGGGMNGMGGGMSGMGGVMGGGVSGMGGGMSGMGGGMGGMGGLMNMMSGGFGGTMNAMGGLSGDMNAMGGLSGDVNATIHGNEGKEDEANNEDKETTSGKDG